MVQRFKNVKIRCNGPTDKWLDAFKKNIGTDIDGRKMGAPSILDRTFRAANEEGHLDRWIKASMRKKKKPPRGIF